MNDIGVKPGDFPFPLVDGPQESRYLTWVRNHSNYLGNRGFLDYLRIVAVLVRGILVNFLTVMPLLLVGALLLSVSYKTLLLDWKDQTVVEDQTATFFLTLAAQEEGPVKRLQDFLGTKAPFVLTPWLALVALVWYLLFPMVIRLFKVVTHKKSTRTGNESSVQLRDRYERTFALALIAVAVAALIEALPLVIHHFHRIHSSDFGWREMFAFTAGGGSLMALSGAGKLLSMLGESKRVLVMPVLALLGLLLPFLVVLYVTEYLVYQTKTFNIEWYYLLALPMILGAGILISLVLSLIKGSVKNPGWLVGLFGVVTITTGAILWLNETIPSDEWFYVMALALEVWLFSWLAVDINLTSVHGLYRDRLAAAFLVGEDHGGDVDIEEDIDLHQICQYDRKSTAPYHLVNTALNLQGSSDIGIRERNSDFFIFSKKFIGGDRTGYCRSDVMEAVFPQMDLATAMAISAAAASPNMGRSTKAPIVALLTLFNIRLGYWVPNPGRLQIACGETPKRDAKADRNLPPGFHFGEVFDEELSEIEKRWCQVYADGSERRLSDQRLSDQRQASQRQATVQHGLVGLGYTGGGIRSASLNLGITQALNQRGVFDHVDYMSTVSGGGYLGASLSTLMRARDEPGDEPRDPPHTPGTLRDRFDWRVRPGAFLREMACKLDEKNRWVNLSDGGHLENMAGIELLRRRCKYVVIGDGEADREMKFNGLATLVRYARIDLGIHIDIDLDDLRLQDGVSRNHFACGEIKYPNEEETGYLLYLKSSLTGKEDEVIKEYSATHEAFPHEATADQFFDEGQFEAYRALGQHIGESVLDHSDADVMTFADLEDWFRVLAKERDE